MHFFSSTVGDVKFVAVRGAVGCSLGIRVGANFDFVGFSGEIVGDVFDQATARVRNARCAESLEPTARNLNATHLPAFPMPTPGPATASLPEQSDAIPIHVPQSPRNAGERGTWTMPSSSNPEKRLSQRTH